MAYKWENKSHESAYFFFWLNLTICSVVCVGNIFYPLVFLTVELAVSHFKDQFCLNDLEIANSRLTNWNLVWFLLFPPRYQLNRSYSPETLYTATTQQTKPPGAVIIPDRLENIHEQLFLMKLPESKAAALHSSDLLCWHHKFYLVFFGAHDNRFDH